MEDQEIPAAPVADTQDEPSEPIAISPEASYVGYETSEELCDPISAGDPLEIVAPTLSLEAKLEAIIFASPKPVRPTEMVQLVGPPYDLEQIQAALSQMLENQHSSGFRLEYIKRQGFQYRTVPEAAPLLEKQFAHRPRPLSRAALETLAIIAYRQPVTRAEVEFIRGVDAGSMMKNLIDRSLICCVGRKPDSGRPMLFGTTDEFLRVFGVGHLKDLPPIESFQPPPELLEGAQAALEDGERDPMEFEELLGDERGEEGASLDPDNDSRELHDEPSESGADIQETLEGEDLQSLDESDPAREITGAIAVPEQVTVDETTSQLPEDAHPEMDLADGDHIAPPSGGMDTTGPDTGERRADQPGDDPQSTD